jgi:ElaB/YqjD/DUF883 family membrane-anchored ribosome-binding protein
MAARNVEQEFDALKSDFGRLSSDLVNLTEAMRGLIGGDAQDTIAKVRTVMGQAGESVEATAAALGARGRKGIACLEHQVRERPLTSILVCLGVGLVLGKLIDR